MVALSFNLGAILVLQVCAQNTKTRPRATGRPGNTSGDPTPRGLESVVSFDSRKMEFGCVRAAVN